MNAKGWSFRLRYNPGHRLEAHATLLLRLADPERASFQTLSEQHWS
jgi:hypothetical protein